MTIQQLQQAERELLAALEENRKQQRSEYEKCSMCNGSGGVQIGEGEYDTCPCMKDYHQTNQKSN